MQKIIYNDIYIFYCLNICTNVQYEIKHVNGIWLHIMNLLETCVILLVNGLKVFFIKINIYKKCKNFKSKEHFTSKHQIEYIKQNSSNMNQELVKIVARFANSLERIQGSERLYVLLVYLSILLDNFLLTAVGKYHLTVQWIEIDILYTLPVPVIPNFLVGINRRKHEQEEYLQIQRDDSNLYNRSINLMAKKYHFGKCFLLFVCLFKNSKFYEINYYIAINGKSIAYLAHTNPNLDTENGQIGLILSSKAFVQLVFNPVVSLIINRLGYELTLIMGVAVLLQSSFCTN